MLTTTYATPSALVMLFLAAVAVGGAQARVPQSVAELWADYDARGEPLEVEVVRQWQEDGGRYRLLLYTAGTFKGARARVAAYYGFPKGGKKLPAILHLHGGGQRANLEYAKYWVSLGYAAMSINWGGNTLEKPETPNTAWGKVDAAFHGPRGRFGGDLRPDAWTSHDALHPENSSWYLVACAGRRALTFLERRPEIDASRLGVTGHSMGGKATTLVAIDPRVRAAVPSVGGTGFLFRDLWGLPGSARHMREGRELYERTIGSEAYWPHIRCPILFLGATNDFNSPTEWIVKAMALLRHDQARLVLAPHLNHRFTADTFAARPLWFEAHLKGALTFPKTARSELILRRESGVPLFRVRPDASLPIARVAVYYGHGRDPRNRFWRDGQASRQGDAWEAKCPVMDLAEPLFAFANVTYALDRELPTPRGYRPTRELTLTSQYQIALPDVLAAAGVRATDQPSRLVDDFARGWHDWYLLNAGNPHHWLFATRKLADARWRGPQGATLAFEVKTTKPDQRLGVTLLTDEWRGCTRRRPGRFLAVVPLERPGWQRIELSVKDFKKVSKEPAALTDWSHITQLLLQPADKAIKDAKLEGGPPAPRVWQGDIPQFRALRWVGGERAPHPKPYLPDAAP